MLNVPYEKKGAPHPGARIVQSPSQSPCPTPGRLSPVDVEMLDPIPRGMVTRLSDLFLDGAFSDDDSVLPVSRLSELIEKHRELNRPPKHPMPPPTGDFPLFMSRDPDSEVDTIDSDTDSESFNAVMDFTDPFLHEDPNFWRAVRKDLSPQSVNSDASSDDDTVTVYGDCDVYPYDDPSSRPITPSPQDEPADKPTEPGQSPRKKRSVVKIDRRKMRQELRMSEVVLPDEPARLTSYKPKMDEGAFGGRMSRSEPDLFKALTRATTSRPSYTTSSPYTRTGREHGMVDSSAMSTSSTEIRYATVMKKDRSNQSPWSQQQRLSQSDSDLAKAHGELYDVGHF